MDDYQDENIRFDNKKRKTKLQDDEEQEALMNPKRVIKYDLDILRKSN